MVETVRLDRLLANRGYCSRREVRGLLRSGAVRVEGHPRPAPDLKVNPADVTFDDQPLDPGVGVVVLLHKPAGYVCSHRDLGTLIYELLPLRWSNRNPPLTSVGRLDADATGLLLLTDDGDLVHRLTSPRHGVAKIYEVRLANPLRGDEVELFASGTMLLEGEKEPLKPAALEPLSAQHVRLVLSEGRYHQIKRMFQACGNEVTALHRVQIGELRLGDLAPGGYRLLSSTELELLR